MSRKEHEMQIRTRMLPARGAAWSPASHRS